MSGLAAPYFGEGTCENRGFEQIIGSSPALQSVLEQVELVGPTDSTVLILGETGTGKELIARAVHNTSRRFGRPFIKTNCAAIPSDLVESELFGHERGAFTGAIAQRIGRFECANGGTLFLDEVGDIPLELQPKLLRVLQERQFERLGSTFSRHVDVRLVAATNQDLETLVSEKQFRIDLYYRLNVFPIAIPPLRARPDDIPLLARHFVEQYAARISKETPTIPDAALATLTAYPWPGNIRELQNYIERAVILTNGDVLEIPWLPCRTPVQTEPATLKDLQRDHILRALQQCNWIVGGKCGAAARLNVKRTTLMDKIRRHGLSRETSEGRAAV